LLLTAVLLGAVAAGWVATAVDRYRLPAGPTAANRRMLLQTGQTDGHRTEHRCKKRSSKNKKR